MSDEQMDLLLDAGVQDEIAGYILDNAEFVGRETDDWIPSDEDEDRVERYKRALRHFQKEHAAAEAKADAEQARIDAWRNNQAKRNKRAMDYLFARLQQFSELTGRKKHDSPNGVLKWQKGRQKVVIVDEDVFLATYAGTDLVRVKQEADKTAIAAQIKSTGDVPNGVEYERSPDTFKVEVPTL